MAQWGNSANPYRFAGAWGYRDDGDAGLLHVGARYYDPQVGRFISRDPVLSEHPYLYCEHEPVMRVDPSGHGLKDLLEDIEFVLSRFGKAWKWFTEPRRSKLIDPRTGEPFTYPSSWERVKDFAKKTWQDIKDFAGGAWQKVKEIPKIVPPLPPRIYPPFPFYVLPPESEWMPGHQVTQRTLSVVADWRET